MTEFSFTKKQIDEILAFKENRLKRINLYSGSVRSGKTFISTILFVMWLCTMPCEKHYIIVARTLTTLRRNILEVMISFFGERNISYSISNKTAIIFGRTVFLEGANDVRSESKIRGVTLAGAYCDELSLIPRDFFFMLLSRLSEPSSKLFATTNPDTPTHWIMKDLILKSDELNIRYVTFLLTDNTSLDPLYIENLQKEFTGVFADRFIKGLWVVAEGAIYKEFSDNLKDFVIDEIPSDFNDPIVTTIGVDFGGNGSAHAFNCTGFFNDMKDIVTLDEYYFKGSLTPTELEDAFVEFAKRNFRYRPHTAYCDSAEQVLINGIKMAVIRNKLPIKVVNAKKGSVTDRIRFYNMLHSKRAYKVLSHCVNTIEAFRTACFNTSVDSDSRLDNGTSNIDSLDAQEYSTEKYQKIVMNIL